MVTHSSILAHPWARIPWTEEPGRLQPTVSQRVGHDWATSLSFSLSLWWFLPYIDMHQPWVYMCSSSWSPLPPPSSSHPSGSSQWTSPEHPVLCIEPKLEIYSTYDNIHVSKLFSQIIPPSPSPRVQKSVLYLCVSFAVSHIGSSSTSFEIPYICINIFCWCFSIWHTSLCIIGSSFIHLIRNDSNAFFLMDE